MENDPKSKANATRFMADVAYLQKKANAFTLEQALDKKLHTVCILNMNDPYVSGNYWSFAIYQNHNQIFSIQYSHHCYAPIEFIGKVLDDLIDGGDIEAAQQAFDAEVKRQLDLRYPTYH